MMHLATRAMSTANVNRERTCCNCWHIKHGTVALGLLELVGVVLLLSGTVNKIIRKSNLTECQQTKSYFSRLFEDCLLRNFSHFDWTLAGDYILALLLTLIFLCIILLFLGIVRKSPMLLLPHLTVQAICLIFSLAYFVLYAWTYFYGDLYVQKNEFKLQSMLERMWLASLLLLLAAFEFYIFFTVIKCCLYLQALKSARLRRIRQFEECSKRVRNAKENGLWRSTSWGGGFQQYKGQYDEDNQWKRKRDKPSAHVQWNLPTIQEKSILKVDDSLRERSFDTKTPQIASNSSSRKSNHYRTTLSPVSSTGQAPNTSASSTSSSSGNNTKLTNPLTPQTGPGVMKSASTSQVKFDRVDRDTPNKRKEAFVGNSMDMQLDEPNAGSSQCNRHELAGGSSRAPKARSESTRTCSGDSSSGTETRHTSQDIKERLVLQAGNCSGDEAVSNEKKPNMSPHYKHRHRHHHSKQETFSLSGSSSKQSSFAKNESPPPPHSPFKKVSIASSAISSQCVSSSFRDIP